MKSGLEIFTGLIIVTVMMLLSTCYMTASINTRCAQNYFASCVTELEASDFAPSVIEELEKCAAENGYVKEDKSSGLEVKVLPDSHIAYVKLNYSYSMDFLGLLLNHEIEGYAG